MNLSKSTGSPTSIWNITEDYITDKIELFSLRWGTVYLIIWKIKFYFRTLLTAQCEIWKWLLIRAYEYKKLVHRVERALLEAKSL